MSPQPRTHLASNAGVLKGSRLCYMSMMISAIIMFAGACTPSEDVAELVIEHRDSSVIVRSPDCKGMLEECGGVQITFPVYVGGSEAAMNVINDRVEAFFVDQLGYGDETGSRPSIKDAAELLMEEYENTLAEFPYMNQVWVVQGTASPVAIDSLVCTEAEVFAYLGGAHPNTTVVFDVARATTGEKLDVATLAVDYDGFIEAAELAFRHSVGMDADDDDYASQGFWFKDNKFVLPENIGVSEDAIILHYNSFEIAPYSMGAFRCILPRSILTSPI